MAPRSKILTALFVVALAPMLRAEEAPKPVLKEGQRVAVVGDSITDIATGTSPDLVPQTVTALQMHFPAALASGHVTTEQVQMALALNDAFQIKCLKAISIGSVSVEGGTRATRETMIEQADAKLYQAKHAGRNRTVAGPYVP